MHQKEKRLRCALWVAVAAVVFAASFLANRLTPYLADDFRYMFHVGTGQRITGLGDLISSQVVHYFQWGGRSVAHTLAQVFLALPSKWVFDVCSAGVFTALILLLYKHSVGDKGQFSPLLLIFPPLLWFTLPVGLFGQCLLWLTGACNYLWTGLVLLAFMLPYRRITDPQNSLSGTHVGIKAAGMLLLGLIAGWCNENTSGAAILFAMGCLLWRWWKKKTVPVWSLFGLAGSVTGFLFLILAPGNYVRAANYEFAGGFLTVLPGRTVAATRIFWTNGRSLCLLFVLLCFLIAVQRQSWKCQLLGVWYFVCGIACNYAMVLAPEYIDRAYFGVHLFLLLACGRQMAQLLKGPLLRGAKPVLAIVAVLLCAWAAKQSIPFYGESLRVTQATEAVYEDIAEQKAAGKRDVQVDCVICYNARCAGAYLAILSEDPSYWINEYFARWQGVDSVTGIRP